MTTASPDAPAASRRVRWGVWSLRISWAVIPFAAGPGFADGLRHTSGPVQAVASIGLWAGWAAGLLAALIPHPASLTILRVLAPAAGVGLLTVALWAGGVPSGPLAAGTAWVALALVWVFAASTAEWCANGPAYPGERRLPLRVPAVLLLGPAPLAWAVVAGGVAAGPLLLASREWVAGGGALAAGGPAVYLLGRSLHALSRRWVVFVPAGLVLHDPLTLADPVLFRRSVVRTLGPAAAAGAGASAGAALDLADLTHGALGLALELATAEPVDLLLVKPGNRAPIGQAATRVLFTPLRPGAVLAEARARRLGQSRM